MRNYDRKFTPSRHDTVMTVEEWLTEFQDIVCTNDDGSGYWIKDGYLNRDDEVFSSDPEDATHVVWYNK